MNKSASTSSEDTAIRPTSSSPARSRFDQDTTLHSDAVGKSSTSDCTDPETTDIPTDECQYEFIVRLEDRHPRAIVCTTHGWTGVID